jgi:RND family efflux transporter MFP subunit
LNAEVSGQIINISPAFEAGSYFSKGDVLVELDARDYKTTVAVTEARLLGAWSALKLATQNLERSTTLFRSNYGSEAAVNQAIANHEQASAELDAAAAQVEQAKRDLERTKIQAPFDGRVRQKSVGLGQSVGPGTTLGVVFAIDFAEVRLPIKARELPYLDLPELPDDSPVEVELRDAISNTSETVWKAMIVRTEGALDEDSLELIAIARVDDPFGRKSGHPPLRIGQPVIGSIAGRVLDNVVAFPRGAVRQLDQVFFVDKTELTLFSKTIVPIWSDEEYVIVRDPLIADGALLSTTSLVYAPNGAKVEIIPDIEITNATAITNTTNKAEPVAN